MGICVLDRFSTCVRQLSVRRRFGFWPFGRRGHPTESGVAAVTDHSTFKQRVWHCRVTI